MSVSIVTYPMAGKDGPTVHVDVELVKSALLYADKVELISFGAAMVGSAAALSHGGEQALLALVTSLEDETISQLSGGRPAPPNWREALLGSAVLAKHPRAHELGAGELGRKYTAMMNEAQTRMGEFAEQLVQDSGAAELLPCIESGTLTLSDAGLSAGADFNAVLPEWTKILQSRLHDGRTRLLFDEGAGDLVSSMIAEGVIESSELGLKHAGQAAVGAGLVARLPAFPQAPMDELLDLRRDLRDALIRYRRAVSRLSRDLPSLVGRELEAHVDALWMAEVAPAILEIEERLADHGLVREIAKSAARDVKTLLLTGAGVYVGMSSMANLGDLISATAAAGGTAAQAIAAGSLASVQGRKEAKRQDLFYLYEADRRLRT